MFSISHTNSKPDSVSSLASLTLEATLLVSVKNGSTSFGKKMMPIIVSLFDEFVIHAYSEFQLSESLSNSFKWKQIGFGDEDPQYYHINT